jgi:hypothetical protein
LLSRVGLYEIMTGWAVFRDTTHLNRSEAVARGVSLSSVFLPVRGRIGVAATVSVMADEVAWVGARFPLYPGAQKALSLTRRNCGYAASTAQMWSLLSLWSR